MQTTGAPPLRVMRVIARLNVGGPAMQLRSLAAGMDPAGFDHRIYAGEVGPGEADLRHLRGGLEEVRPVPGLGPSPKVLGDLRALVFLVAEMRRFRPHVVHTHTAKAGVLGRLAALVARVPVRVHTYHGHLLHGYGSRLRAEIVRRVEQAMALVTTQLVAVGAAVRAELLEAGIGRSDAFDVIAPGIELEGAPTRGEARSALGLADGDVALVFVGRLTLVKRADRLAAVADQVLRREPSTVLLVAGGGDDSALAHLASRHGDRVRLLGWRSDVARILSAADVVLLTSDNEGMPVSLVEAALAGVPAVTTAVGSAAEVVLDGRTGRVVPPEVAPFVEAVVDLVRDRPLRAAMGRAAREHARASFTPNRLVADHESLYRRLTGTTVA